MQDYYDKISGVDSAIASAAEFARKNRIPTEEYSTDEKLKAVASQAFSEVAAYKLWDRADGNIETDPDFHIDRETRKDIRSKYSQRETQLLLSSKNQDHFLSNQKYIDEDREMNKVLSEMGLVNSTAAIMGLSLFDPVNWLSLGSLKAFQIYKHGNRAVRALKAGGIVGVENMALESMFYASNTQAHVEDILFAGATGGALGTTLGAMSRHKSPTTAKYIDDADASLRADAERVSIREAEAKARANGARSELSDAAGVDDDMVKINQDMRLLEASLKEQERLKLKPHQVDSILEELAFIEARRLEIGRVSDVDPRTTTTPSKEWLDSLARESQELDAKARKLEQDLDLHIRAEDAAKFKKKWKSWSLKKKMERLYPKGRPNRVEDARVQREAKIASDARKIAETETKLDPEELRLAEEEARLDPDYRNQLDSLDKEASKLKLKVKEDIEAKYNCEVIV